MERQNDMRQQQQEKKETAGTGVGRTFRKGTETWKTGTKCVQECKSARVQGCKWLSVTRIN